MKQYLDIVRKVLAEGVRSSNRTGMDTLSVSGVMFEHEMSEGFPLLTTKKMPFGLIASELEFFLRGLTDKRWLQERNSHIWDAWCNPYLVLGLSGEERKQRMRAESDLGPIYGWQWRHFGARCGSSLTGFDQLAGVLHDLRHDPTSRRMVVSAWDPRSLHESALPPCHFAWQVTVSDGRLNLLWSQRSVDVALGLPFNIASYGLLLHLLARHAGLRQGKLVGFLADTHIYLNHVDGLRMQLERTPLPLPMVCIPIFTSVTDWRYTDAKVVDYAHHQKIEFTIAV